MFRRRRTTYQDHRNQKKDDQVNSSYSNSESSDDHYQPEEAPWKNVDIEDVVKCEAHFFCEVLNRLSKQLKRARDIDDLDEVICMATKFLQASAEKEKAIACKISSSKDFCCPVKADCHPSKQDYFESDSD